MSKLADSEGNGNPRNADEKELAKLKAEHSSGSSFVQLLASIGVPTMMNGSSQPVFQEFETPRSPFGEDSIIVSADKRVPSSVPSKSYKADANNARLDHMVQKLDAKIERTHEMLLQVKEDYVEVMMKKLDIIMKKLNVDSIDLERRSS